jgi:hypothetical protein
VNPVTELERQTMLRRDHALWATSVLALAVLFVSGLLVFT